MSIQLILGTGNAKKAQEIRAMVDQRQLQITTLADWPGAIDVVEDGDSFAANAKLKSTRQAIHLGQWVVGEDSGLSVDALQGEPGIYSARFSGEQSTDQSNNQLLLERLADIPLDRRTAHYSCHLSLSDPQGNERLTASDICRGRILETLSGEQGFGYDPMFEIPEYHLTFGQLGPSVKKALSHRSRALRKFLPAMMRLLNEHAAS